MKKRREFFKMHIAIIAIITGAIGLLEMWLGFLDPLGLKDNFHIFVASLFGVSLGIVIYDRL